MKMDLKKKLIVQTYLKSLENSEDLCSKCPVKGSCCYAAVQKSNGDVVGLSLVPCKFLCKSSGTCSVYEDRYEKNPSCLPIEDAILQKAVPEECLYIQGLTGYIGKKFVTIEEEKKLLTNLVKSLDVDNLPKYLPDDIVSIVKSYNKK